MKKLFALFLICYNFCCGQSLYVGVTSTVTLVSASHAGHPHSGTCWDWTIEHWSNCVYPTGMKLYLRIDSIQGPSNSIQISRYPDYSNSPVSVNDTIRITPSSSGIYVYYLNISTLYVSLIAIGTPQVYGENYYCNFSKASASILDGCGPEHVWFAGGNGSQDTVKNCMVTSTTPIANFTYTSVCSDTVTCFTDLSVSSSPIVSYAWDFGDGTTSTLQHPCCHYAASGTYTVTEIVTDNLGNSDTVRKSVEVYPLPNVSCYASPDTINSGTMASVLHASANGISSNGSYTWTPCCAISSQSGPTVSANPTVTTCYTVTVTDTNGCKNHCQTCLYVSQCSNSITYSVIATPESCQGCCDGNIQISNLTGGCSPYQISVSPGNQLQNLCGGTTYSITVQDAGCCTASSYTSCVDFSGCGATTNIANSSSKNSKITISPNPAIDHLFVESNAPEEMTLDLMDMGGRKVFSKNIISKTNIDISTLNNGLYYYHLTGCDNAIQIGKVVILSK
ncbi:MAG: PKD domain-containing protein [Bacteroidia bacterium]